MTSVTPDEHEWLRVVHESGRYPWSMWMSDHVRSVFEALEAKGLIVQSLGYYLLTTSGAKVAYGDAPETSEGRPA